MDYRIFNPFTAMMSKMTNKSEQFQTLNCFFFFLHCHVKGFSSKHRPLKVDVIGVENTLFTSASVIFQPGNFTDMGNEGVNVCMQLFCMHAYIYYMGDNGGTSVYRPIQTQTTFAGFLYIIYNMFQCVQNFNITIPTTGNLSIQTSQL